MRHAFLPSRTLVAWLGATALAVLLLVDAGSLVLTRTSTPDRARDAGRAAAQAVEGLALTQRSAVVAYDAAVAVAEDHALHISTEDFRVFPDGHVQLTASRTAPTLLMHRLPRLGRYVRVSTTEIVDPSPYGSTAP
ncbi:hypothetical protein DDE18_16150 [Nocardioides gansuensis]|uniref:Uncharacterized protein n=1 Tax=Nocardioides gansuensis TaxID=2138300 RepID=A0A2T8F755_9ACTN|nr:hypothetical protein [Nocardioides gansuensis]PVG81543.1 hypothetical protein DDE18_16150 [Nocardioides gansuensis]